MTETYQQSHREIIRALAASFKWWSRRPTTVFEISGSSKLEPDIHFRFLLFGSMNVASDIAHTFLTTHEIKSAELDASQLHALDQCNKCDGFDLIFRERSPVAIMPKRDGKMLCTQIDSFRSVTKTLEEFLSLAGESTRKKARKSMETSNVFSSEIADHDSLTRFVTEMLGPSAVRRFGQSAVVPNVSELEDKQNKISLIHVDSPTGDQRLGTLMSIISGKRSLRLSRIGLNMAVAADSSLRDSVTTGLELAGFKIAISDGFKYVSLGQCKASSVDGIHVRKSRWGMSFAPLNGYPRCEMNEITESGKKLVQSQKLLWLRADGSLGLEPELRADPAITANETSAEHQAKSVLSSAGKLGSSLVVTLLLALILRIAIPRAFGPEGLGVMQYCESFAFMFLSLIPLGVSAYITKEIPPNRQHARLIYRPLLYFGLVFGLLLFGLMYLSSFQWAPADIDREILVIMGLYVGLMVYQKSVLKRLFVAMGSVGLIAKLDVVVKVALVVMGMSVIFWAPSVRNISYCFLISELLGLGILLWAGRAARIHDGPYRTGIVAHMLAVSMPFFFVNSMLDLYSSLDVIMLGKMSSSAEVGYYSAANRLKSLFMVAVPIMQGSIQPMLSRLWRNDKWNFLRICRRMYSLLLAGSTLMMAVLTFTPDLLMVPLFGHDFESSYRTLAWLAPVIGLTYLNVLFGTCMNIASDGKAFGKVAAATLLLNALLNLFFIPFALDHYGEGGGAAGAAAATVISETIMMLGLMRAVPKGLVRQEGVIQLVIYISSAVTFALLHTKLMGLELWLRAFLGVFVSLSVLWAAQLVRREDIMLIRRLFRKESLGDAL
jgi:O-antigen/teichoic acid export membrane protein